jgi:hypothetical protein
MTTTLRPPTPIGLGGDSRSRPGSDAHIVRPASQADLARAYGVARSTVSRAVRPGGALHGAVIAGSDRIDLAHPACRAWRAQPTASACRGCGALAGRPYAGTTVEEFAARAEVSVDVVRVALRDELAPALRDGGRLDIGHAAALGFLARYPFASNEHGDPLDPVIDGHDFVCAACVDENRHDFEHPVFRAFLARYFGRVPTAEDAAAFASP